MYPHRAKRLFDCVVIVPALLALSPLAIVLAALVYADLGAPIIFRQWRLGYGGVPFQLLKFRTMTNARDAQGDLLPDHRRITRLGGWLRRTSLDSLPELLNVLAGHMSLVGPRPLLAHYHSRYTSEQMRRHALRPGITGWAQINGRNAISWEQRFAYDLWYVDHMSFALDLRILVRTVSKVLRRVDINQAEGVTMSEFRGHSAVAEPGTTP